MSDDDIELETFDEMVGDLRAGTPAQQLAARDLTEAIDIETLAELLVETGAPQ